MESTTKAGGINTYLDINIMELSVGGMYGTREATILVWGLVIFKIKEPLLGFTVLQLFTSFPI